MSFGWSVGDVIAGLKVVWDIWQAVSDGPLNARFEASQFFDEYVHIMSRLQKWESRKTAFSQDKLLANSQRQLREQCTLFLKDHIRLIQQVNPATITQKEGRSTWLKKAPFTKDQVISLYQQVQWPMEREVVTKLRIKLQFFLDVASFDVAMDTNDTLHQMRTENVDLMSSNLKLVTSHLEMVSLVKDNLRRITNPLEPGRQAAEIDYPMLRQFDQALRIPQALPRPQPMLPIEAGHARSALPWQQNSRVSEAELVLARPQTSAAQNANGIDNNDIRDLIERRLDNLSMRVRRDAPETIFENEEAEDASIISLLKNLKSMRGRISDAVGVLRRQNSNNELSLVANNPEGALKAELEAWDMLEERMEREILHPPRQPRRQQLTVPPAPLTSPTRPMDIPRRQTLSQNPQYDAWPGSMSSSPGSKRASYSSSPSQTRPTNTRNSSHSPISRPVSVQLNHLISVTLYYSDYTLNGVIQTLRRNSDGEVESISCISNDGCFKVHHSIDYQTPSSVETTMKPFLDNRQVFPDEAHKWRVQFKGAHCLKIMTVLGNQTEKLFGSLQCPPIYKFHNDEDFKEFQRLLLNKEVIYICDVCRIDPTTGSKHPQCHLGTIRILLDPFSRTRSILYFRHTPEHKGFVEWPINCFKTPREPARKAKLLTLQSQDDKSLSQSKPLSRHSTFGSVATMASFETQPGNALARNSEKSSLKGLVVEFYSYADCHAFWMEFTARDVEFTLNLDLHRAEMEQDRGLGLDFGNMSPG